MKYREFYLQEDNKDIQTYEYFASEEMHYDNDIHVIEHQAYTDLKQQAYLLYEALEAAKTAVTYAHADLMDEYYLDAKRYFDRTLKTYESFIEESEK